MKPFMKCSMDDTLSLNKPLQTFLTQETTTSEHKIYINSEKK